jgi:hypothetical protein
MDFARASGAMVENRESKGESSSLKRNLISQ